MGSRYTGIFAIPASHMAELREHYRAWIKALDSQEETSHVMANAVYSHAADIALAHRSIKRRRRWSTVNEIHIFILNMSWKNKIQSLFEPAECKRLRRAIDNMERHLGGEEELLRRVQKRIERVRMAVLSESYHAMKEVLDAAISHGAGYFITSFDEDAEASLARRRREQAKLEAAWAAHRPRADGKSAEERMAMLMEKNEQRLLASLGKETPADMPAKSHVILFSVLEEDLAEIRQKFTRADEAPAGTEEARELLLDAHDTVADFSLGRVSFEQRGDTSAFKALDPLLLRDCPGVYRADRIYASEDARALQAAVDRWEEAQGGEAAVIERLTAASYGKERCYAEEAYRGFKFAVMRAIRDERGLVILLDTLI